MTNHLKDFRVLFLGLALILLNSCGTSTDFSLNESSDRPIPQQAQEQIGTGGQLISIQSDNVSAAGYDATTQTMTVRFDSGATYEYYQVPASTWISFIAAQPHPWSQVGYPILVQGGFPYARVG